MLKINKNHAVFIPVLH